MMPRPNHEMQTIEHFPEQINFLIMPHAHRYLDSVNGEGSFFIASCNKIFNNLQYSQFMASQICLMTSENEQPNSLSINTLG